MTNPTFTHDGKVIQAEDGYLDELREAASRKPRGRFLEWGSGLSTMVLAEVGSTVYTIDHHKEWQHAMWCSLTLPVRNRVVAISAELDGISRPPDARGLLYSTVPLKLPGPWDLVVIDGRRRIECSLVAALVSSPDTLVLLHDYLRESYRPILKLYDVVDTGLHYRTMRVKPAALSLLGGSA